MKPITNDAVILGLLMLILGLVFVTSQSNNKIWKKFYGIVPALLMCYFLPSLLPTLGIIDTSKSQLYFVSSRYLLPASLVLFTISVDLREIIKLGPKALIMFLTGTVGIVLGGPISILVFSAIAPDIVTSAAPNEVWRGMTTIAGAWIGGGANQAAMKEVFEVNGDLFSKMVAVDVIVGNTWLGVLLAGVGFSTIIDRKLKADNSAIESLKNKMDAYQQSIARMPTFLDIMKILMVAFGSTGLAHFLSDLIAPALAANFPFLSKYSLTSGFFWLAVISTTLGVILSFTKAKTLEGVGASRIGSAFLYVLIAAIGMNMNIMSIFENPGLFLVGITWMLFHVGLLILVAKLIKAPYFFVAVGSTANVGGAASSPVIASSFHPSLAPVGVLLAVFGYVLGTYGAYLCGLLMQTVSP
ncbi:MAG: DUF819 family protein [Cyclobacteriaceae bacterium]